MARYKAKGLGCGAAGEQNEDEVSGLGHFTISRQAVLHVVAEDQIFDGEDPRIAKLPGP